MLALMAKHRKEGMPHTGDGKAIIHPRGTAREIGYLHPNGNPVRRNDHIRGFGWLKNVVHIGKKK